MREVVATSLLAEPALLLAPQEEDVLAAALTTKKNKEIAESLGIGLRTVEDTISRLKKKLRVPNLTALGSEAQRLGLLRQRH